MVLPTRLKRFNHQRRLRWTLVKTYRAMSAAPIDTIWGKINNLTDVSWNPMLSSSEAPRGLQAKPGLIYQAMSHWSPIPSRLFIETVKPNQFLSVRIFALPGLEERITYHISDGGTNANETGTLISYSIMLRGWLAPIIWPFLHVPAQRVAKQLAHAAELDGLENKSISWLSKLIDF